MIEPLLEPWSILDENESKEIWNKVYSKFSFNPKREIAYDFKINVDVYDITNSLIWTDNEEINTIIKTIFIECMDKDDYMYALDWQHSDFKYNPKNNTLKESPEFIVDKNYHGGGYNAYFPEFYPNGDYYLFISKNFSWGYLTCPWSNKIWVYGECLMSKIKNHSEKLGFTVFNNN